MFGLFKKKPPSIQDLKKNKKQETQITQEELIQIQQIIRTYTTAKAKAIHTPESISLLDEEQLAQFTKTINKLYDELKTLKKYEVALQTLANQTQTYLEKLRDNLGEVSSRLTRDENTTIQYIKTINHQINTILDQIITLQKHDFTKILNERKEPNKCMPINIQESIKIKKQLIIIETNLQDLKEKIIYLKELEEQTNNSIRLAKLN